MVAYELEQQRMARKSAPKSQSQKSKPRPKTSTVQYRSLGTNAGTSGEQKRQQKKLRRPKTAQGEKKKKKKTKATDSSSDAMYMTQQEAEQAAAAAIHHQNNLNYPEDLEEVIEEPRSENEEEVSEGDMIMRQQEAQETADNPVYSALNENVQRVKQGLQAMKQTLPEEEPKVWLCSL